LHDERFRGMRRRETECYFFAKAIDSFACDEGFFGINYSVGGIDGGCEA